MPDMNRWEKLKPLGEGGQGQVFLVRTPTRRTARDQAKAQIYPCIANIGAHQGASSDSIVQSLLEAITEYSRPDSPNELGALKQFKIATDDKGKEAEAVGRLQAEIEVLQRTSHPAVLRLLDANVDERFIVTEFHPGGTLDKHLARYKGKALEALAALRPLVEALAAIHHQHGAIHRDIKTENIFVATDGRLVLGDFGVVFFTDGQRLTKTYERVGSHFWMAPWAYKNERLAIEQINPSLDIFPLVKVLWSMISGRNGFPYWEWEHDENNLEAMFPDSPMVALINRHVISKCVVREEKDCTAFAPVLLREIDALIERGKRVAQRMDGETTWPCRICGKGTHRPAVSPAGVNYGPLLMLAQRPGGAVSDRQPFSICVCDHCGHAELFKAYGG
ncbi:MAG: protein kinase [Bryobacteraceae bacterium]|jgi:serine/threonine protein kinase